MKQDLNGVRTAQDLERKYNFSSIQKAIKQTEDSLTKVNTELDNFVTSTTQNLEELQTQLDGKMATYYYSGLPTLENLPASEWEDYEQHVGDMYYDRDTGKAYIFDVASDIYSWNYIEDNDITEALALANSAQDTADNKRRVFLIPPIPPYDNGDLWLNEQEIYVCQVSKAAGEVYEENDFIIATKYTDDTVATQVGNELTVVKGQVTTINEKANGLEVVITENTSMINSITEEVVHEIDERSAMIRLRQEAGIPVVELGTTESPVKTKYKNDGMYIEENGQTTSYYKNGKAYTKDMEATNSLTIGRFAWKPRVNGNTSLVYLGGGE